METLDPDNRDAFDLWRQIAPAALDGMGGVQFSAIEFVSRDIRPAWRRREAARKLIVCMGAHREWALKKVK